MRLQFVREQRHVAIESEADKKHQEQQAQIYGAGLFGEATASGIDALLGAEIGRGNIIGTAGTGLLAGLVAPDGILQSLI